MVELDTLDTPNERQVSILPGKLGLAYSVDPMDIFKDEPLDPAFLKLSPNDMIPAIVQENGVEGRRTLRRPLTERPHPLAVPAPSFGRTPRSCMRKTSTAPPGMSLPAPTSP